MNILFSVGLFLAISGMIIMTYCYGAKPIIFHEAKNIQAEVVNVEKVVGDIKG